ncbi:MAG: efflux RND transporter periplasmic adaptor subunit, partial [Firmicutes bacterium]|nr:efflux RND transporter periplasmic adaptor subunit [Bacillota bacterium]
TAQAGLESARANYDHAFIKSPISGVVTAVNINPGELASPGSPTPVVTVINLDKVVVKATVTEGQINTLKQGQQVPVMVTAVSATPLTGVITDISPAADAASKAYPIKVQLDNKDHLLKPGMFAELRLSQSQPATLLAPKEAVVQIGGVDNVWIVVDGKATSQPVTTGSSDEKNIQILKGLKEGDQVVTSGQNMLQENAKVEIKKPAATTPAGASSAGTTSAGVTSGGTTAAETKSGEATPSGAASAGAASSETKSAETKSGETN